MYKTARDLCVWILYSVTLLYSLIFFVIQSLSSAQLFVTLYIAAHQAFLSFTVSSVQFSSVAQSCPTLCNPMNRSTPGLPVHYQLPDFTQTHVHRVSDAIQPSHPLSSPSPPAPNPSQHQRLFQWELFTWGGQSTGVSALASFLPKMPIESEMPCNHFILCRPLVFLLSIFPSIRVSSYESALCIN